MAVEAKELGGGDLNVHPSVYLYPYPNSYTYHVTSLKKREETVDDAESLGEEPCGWAEAIRKNVRDLGVVMI